MVILVPFVLFGFRSTIAVFLSAKEMQSSSVFSFLVFFATLGAFPFPFLTVRPHSPVLICHSEVCGAAVSSPERRFWSERSGQAGGDVAIP